MATTTPRAGHTPHSAQSYEPPAPPPPHLHPLHATAGHGDDDELGFLDRLRAPYADEHETLGLRLIRTLGFAFGKVWRSSHTVLRLDISRPISLHGQVPTPWQRGGGIVSGAPRPPAGRLPGYPGAFVSSSSSLFSASDVQRRNLNADEDHPERSGQDSSGWLSGIQGSGAKVKLMQIWDFPSNKDNEKMSLPWNLSFGMGARVEMDKEGGVEPLMRIRSKHIIFHLLPSPLLEFRGKWPLGGTELALNVHYSIPLLELDRFWESPSSKFTINFYNPIGTGFHLTPGGLEFDEQVVNVGKYTTMRVAASINFPRQLPLEEGQQLIKVNVHRLGLKARII